MPAKDKIDKRVYGFMTCSKCGKKKRIKDHFYKMKDKDTWLDICKPCLTKFIDNRDPDTFKWILAKFDLPYVEHLWIKIANDEYSKNPSKFGNASVLGLYIRMMKLKKWIKYGYADSDYLNESYLNEIEDRRKFYEENQERLKELKVQLDNGEISKEDYEIYEKQLNVEFDGPIEFLPELVAGIVPKEEENYDDVIANRPESVDAPPEPDYLRIEYIDVPEEPSHDIPEKKEPPKPQVEQVQIEPMMMIPPPKPKPKPKPKPEPEPEPPPQKPEPEPEPEPEPDPIPEPQPMIDFINEDDIAKELEEEDMRYLALKWGVSYKPSEWVFMEELYCKYTNEYELNADREDTLRKMCKTSLLLDRSLNEGEAQNAQKYASILDNLRKSAKFTDSQKKEEQERYLDSVGELVAFCEKEGGIIEQLPPPDEYPQDKIDLTIRDLQNYTRNLATNELGLSNLIESYIAKLERREQEKLDDKLEDGLITSQEEEYAYYDKEAMSYDDAVDFQGYIDTQIATDSLMVLDLLESGEV